MPLIMTDGWPGSVLEVQSLIGPPFQLDGVIGDGLYYDPLKRKAFISKRECKDSLSISHRGGRMDFRTLADEQRFQKPSARKAALGIGANLRLALLLQIVY